MATDNKNLAESPAFRLALFRAKHRVLSSLLFTTPLLLTTMAEIEQKIEAAIQAALQPGGAISTKIEAAITAATTPGGQAALGTEKIVDEAVAEHGKVFKLVSDSLDAAIAPTGVITKMVTEFTSNADKEYPWRPVLRRLTVPEWDTAWKTLMADPDHSQRTKFCNVRFISCNHFGAASSESSRFGLGSAKAPHGNATRA